MVHRRRADERRRRRREHERDQVQYATAGPELAGEQEHETADRQAGRRGEQLSGALRMRPPQRRRDASEPAGEREPERRRVPDAGLARRGQSVLRGDDLRVPVVRERVVSAEPVVPPGVRDEQRRLRGEDRADGERVPAAAVLSTHSRRSPGAASGTARAATGRGSVRARRAWGRHRPRPRTWRGVARPPPRSRRCSA